jgi:hypothetical protein
LWCVTEAVVVEEILLMDAFVVFSVHDEVVVILSSRQLFNDSKLVAASQNVYNPDILVVVVAITANVATHRITIPFK